MKAISKQVRYGTATILTGAVLVGAGGWVYKDGEHHQYERDGQKSVETVAAAEQTVQAENNQLRTALAASGRTIGALTVNGGEVTFGDLGQEPDGQPAICETNFTIAGTKVALGGLTRCELTETTTQSTSK
jgi:hypothetical protein